MTLWAIIPVKPLRRGKSRLATVLSQTDRLDLNRRLLTHTLETLSAIPQIEQVLVVSRDPAALALAREHGARTIREDRSSHLNVALTRATIIAKTYTTRGVLILPADLPLLTAEDINEMLVRSQDPPVVVIAPDHRREGTNALLISPAGLIEYDFGPGSFERHCARVNEAGARLEVCELRSLALDVDQPGDLELLDLDFNDTSRA